MLNGGFRHQDDEFISAVAGDDIGPAAIGFQNVANALQYKIAFEMSVEIVDELEAIEVHQDEREGTGGARRALPLGGKRFHKEAMGLDAGQTIGDGLFL